MHSWPHRTAVRTLCATTCSGRATFAAVTAAPCLLGDRPSCHPIRITCIAIVRQRGGLATTCCWWAALSMDLAAPSLFPNTPSCDPIGETIRAIVWICWPHWQHWLDRQYWHHWLDRQYWHHNWGYGGHLCGTALVVDSAAPTLLSWCPSGLRIYGAIERVGWKEGLVLQGSWEGMPTSSRRLRDHLSAIRLQCRLRKLVGRMVGCEEGLVLQKRWQGLPPSCRWLRIEREQLYGAARSAWRWRLRHLPALIVVL